MLTCERFEAQLDDHVSGEMGIGAKLSFALHWLMCRACRISLATYHATVTLTRNAFDDDDDQRKSGAWSRRRVMVSTRPAARTDGRSSRRPRSVPEPVKGRNGVARIHSA